MDGRTVWVHHDDVAGPLDEVLDRNPAAVYLAGKLSATGRRGLKRSLHRAAELLTSGRTKDAMAVDWTEVRYQHVTALRSVRPVAVEAWRRGSRAANGWT